MNQHEIAFIKFEEVADDTYKYVFEKPENYSFVAGQYVVLEILNPVFTDDRPAFRSLSMSSAPDDENLEFIMRTSDSGFKKSIHALKEGDKVTVKGPLGHMRLPEDTKTPVVFLVAGVGVTPARSMLLDAQHRDSQRTFRMIYSNRELCTAACFDEICDIKLANYKVINVMSDTCENWDGPVGRVDADFIKENTSDLTDPTFYIVGTKGYIEGMKKALAELEITQERIIIDNFG